VNSFHHLLSWTSKQTIEPVTRGWVLRIVAFSNKTRGGGSATELCCYNSNFLLKSTAGRSFFPSDPFSETKPEAFAVQEPTVFQSIENRIVLRQGFISRPVGSFTAIGVQHGKNLPSVVSDREKG